jgi:hypothetical protein
MDTARARRRAGWLEQGGTENVVGVGFGGVRKERVCHSEAWQCGRIEEARPLSHSAVRSSTAKSFVSEISDPCSCKSPPCPGRCRKYVGQTYPFSTARPKNVALSARAGGEKCKGKTAIGGQIPQGARDDSAPPVYRCTMHMAVQILCCRRGTDL